MHLSVISVPAFSQGRGVIRNILNTEELNTDLLFSGTRKYFGYFLFKYLLQQKMMEWIIDIKGIKWTY